MNRKVNIAAAILALATLTSNATSAKAVEIIKRNTDKTNTYIVQPLPSTVVGTTRVIESPAVITSDGLVTREISSPAVIYKSTGTNVVVEDQLVKEKHLFKLGLGPLFQFHIK